MKSEFDLVSGRGRRGWADEARHVNRTLPVEAYTYTPQESWTFLHDDGRVEGNATFLSEYTDSKMGSTSMSMTDKAASVDITFTGMSPRKGRRGRYRN
jgi:hypothetical protein